MMKLQLLGWAPDLDPATPGILVDSYNVIPTTDGVRALLPRTTVASISTAGYPRTFICVPSSGSSSHTVVSYYTGSTANTCVLYEVSYGGIWTSRGSYTAGSYTTPVMFRQFDTEIFAARNGSPMKYAAQGADFTAVTGAPSAALIESNRDFLIAFDAGGYDWWCSAIGDAHDWTPSVSNQCVRGSLYNKAGPITCASRVGESVLMFTISQTWLGRYVGAPEVWQWEQLSNSVGCIGAEAAVSTPYGTVWIGRDDIYIYNGATIAPINTTPVKRTIFGYLNTAPKKIPYSAVAWDQKNGLLWVFTTSGTPQQLYTVRSYSYCYHFETQRWSTGNFTVAGVNHGTAHEFFGIDSVSPTLTYTDTPFVITGDSGGYAYIVRFNGDDQVNASGYIQTAYFGDNFAPSMVRSLRAKYSDRAYAYNGTATLMTNLKTLSHPITGGATATQTATLDADLKYMFRQTGRWHSVRLNIVGEDIVSELDVDIVPMGAR